MCRAHVDAADPRGLRVGADRVGELAVARVPQRHVKDHRRGEEDDHRHRARADPGVVVGQHRDRLAARVELRHRAGRHHHAERGDEGRDGRDGDQGAVDQPRDAADDEAAEQRNHEGQPRQGGEDRPGVARLLRQRCRHHGGDRQHRARRQVDAARDDHLRDADGDQPHDGHLQDHHQQALRVAEEALPPHAPAHGLEEQGDADQHQHDAELVGQAPPPGLALRHRDRIGQWLAHLSRSRPRGRAL